MYENGYFNVLTVFSVRFWLEPGKNMKDMSTFFILYNCFEDIPCFFLQGDINCW